ncbi:hypothetical protein [Acinetobacter sp. Ac_5812]|uniref:hypothetical protein n=1 Tax=Acinetobacter sp. Ac_5812 TaxID=1848937 RepID=UPI001490420D|nr:hypothetical protein [Acinetobacter sp. Ac_5812]NNP68931.1 hypothetical protein [Acinetobacter sp. Ac_5812]
MEQTTILSNPAVRFGAGAIGVWVLMSLLIAAIFAAIWHNINAPLQNLPPTKEERYSFQNEFFVSAGAIHKNSGEALVKLEGFNIPVKFDFETDPKIEITNLEIGQITTVYGKDFNDFTNWEDHKAINAALVAYIKKNGVIQ